MKIVPYLLLFITFQSSFGQTYYLTRGLPVTETAGSGTAITTLTDNNSTVALQIGFSFNFYGNTYTDFYLNSNGFISFGSGSTTTSITIPSTSNPNNVIAFAATDLNCSVGTPTINYFTTGTSPNRILIINFKNVQHKNNPANLTSVQIKLFEGSTGTIEIHSTSNESGTSTTGGNLYRTIGIENSTGSLGVTTSDLNFSSTVFSRNETIRFEQVSECSNTISISASTTTICEGLTTSTLSSTISPTGTFTYQWYRNNAPISGANGATYTASLIGTYFLRIAGTGGCVKQSSSTVINRTFNPTVSVTSPFVCNSISVNTIPNGSYTYQWYKDNVAISGQTSISTIPQGGGAYNVRVTSGGCSVFAPKVLISANTVSATNNIANVCTNLNLTTTTSSSPSTRTFSWTGPNNFSSTLQNPDILNTSSAYAGVYTTTVNFGCNEIRTATTNVTIATPTISLSPSQTLDVCQTLYLSPSISYAPNRTYSWSGPNNFTSTLASPSISNLTSANAGIYSLTVNFGCEIKTATTNITLTNPYTVSEPNSYSTNICRNITLYPTVSYSSTQTYSWAGPNGFSSTLKNAVINNPVIANSGIYTITVNFGCGGIKSATTNVTISPNTVSLPSSYSTNFCTPIQLIPSISYTPNQTFSWVGPNGYYSTNQNPTITNPSNNSSGTYTVTVNFGCNDIKTATTNLTVNPNQFSVWLHNSHTITSCNQVNFNPTISYSPNQTYSWTGPNSFSSTDQSPSLINPTVANTGIYTLTVNFGCGEIRTATTHVTVNPNTVWLPSFGETNICNPLTLNPYVTVTPTRNYSWAGPNSFSSTQEQITITTPTISNAGIYTLTVNFGCGEIKTATTNVIINPNSTTLYNYHVTACSSQTLNPSLSYTPTRNYSWAGPNGFTSTSFSANLTNITNANVGIYTLTVNFGCNDIKTATTSLSVEPLRVYCNSDAFSTNCSGTSVQLRANPDYGAPTGSYLWTGPNNFTSNERNPLVILGANSGVYTVTANFGDCGIATATTEIIIGPPSISASSSATSMVCASSSVDLFTYVNGSTSYNLPSPTITSYSWSGPNNFTSTLRNPTISNTTLAHAGFYTVTVTLSGGCTGVYTAIAAVNITQNPELTTNFNSTGNFVCEGYPVILRTLTNPLGNTVGNYVWTGPNGYSSSIAQPTVTPMGSGGVYTVTATFTSGCIGTHSALLTVFTSRKPSIYLSNSTTSCVGNTLSLPSIYISSTLNYSWVGPNGFSSTQNGATVSTSATTAMGGIYTVTVTDPAGGCPIPFVGTTNVSIYSNCGTGGSCYNMISGGGSICSGGSTTLSTSFSRPGNADYRWSGPNGYSSHGQYANIRNITTGGIYTITTTVSTGECAGGTYTSTTSITIDNNPTDPILSLNTSINSCEGSAIYFSTGISNSGTVQYATLTGPNGLVFYGTGGAYLNLDNGLATASGTYTLNATVQRACNGPITQQSVSKQVTINPRPSPPTISVSSMAISLGESVTLSSSGCASGNNLIWLNSMTTNPLIDTPTSNTAYWAVCRSTANSSCLSGSSNVMNVTIQSCQQLVNLLNPSNNYTSGTITKQARASDGLITATNQITGTAKATYQAKSIQLNAGFKAENGTVFKAEIGGCN